MMPNMLCPKITEASCEPNPPPTQQVQLIISSLEIVLFYPRHVAPMFATHNICDVSTKRYTLCAQCGDRISNECRPISNIGYSTFRMLCDRVLSRDTHLENSGQTKPHMWCCFGFAMSDYKSNRSMRVCFVELHMRIRRLVKAMPQTTWSSRSTY